MNLHVLQNQALIACLGKLGAGFVERLGHDYIQQIGRAGRDGKPALCLLMYSTPEFDRLREQAAKEDIEETRALRKQQVEELISFLQAKGCRHQGLTAYFGEKLPPCKATRARGSCDVCAPAKAPRLP